MIRATRQLSTKSVIDKLFNVVQSSSYDERQTKLDHLIDTYARQRKAIYPNLVNDVIQRWALEQPKREALWMCESKSNESEILTFDDVYKQSCRLANVLTNEEFDLAPGQTVLVILPNTAKERILLLLACIQTGLIFCPYDPKDLTNAGISERIRKLVINCVITDENNLDMVRYYTGTPLRPLKKGYFMPCSKSKLSPVSWTHLMQHANNAESRYTKFVNINHNTPIIRLLSNNNNVIEYSQEALNLRLILAGLWLNSNKTPRLIWMKNQNEIISMASWLFGSSIFYKETETLKSMVQTFENYPIDAFCATLANYQMLENEHEQQREITTNLQQLFSTESITSKIKSRWHSLTNLYIRDDYPGFYKKPILNDFSKHVRQTAYVADKVYITSNNEFLNKPKDIKKNLLINID
ncbi:unnamed protein product [Rotaria sp. Silwood2]|nr:unnamed protein product [Rotaria sp. Silwood2]CAF3038726.1 unnamed protein product [Rotaria sp. Silwood2]CAF4123059.1 unnamed protein product [Rotaria sp. Silwood2]CAF4230256.1 unnamed protein product [Rotaria sp. Silwood2]CAF4319977.1 unnamed protein product [Rotaria sp. Silwood2]